MSYFYDFLVKEHVDFLVKEQVKEQSSKWLFSPKLLIFVDFPFTYPKFINKFPAKILHLSEYLNSINALFCCFWSQNFVITKILQPKRVHLVPSSNQLVTIIHCRQPSLDEASPSYSGEINGQNSIINVA